MFEKKKKPCPEINYDYEEMYKSLSRDMEIVQAKHVVELQKLQVVIDNANATAEHAINKATDELRESLKKEILVLTEAKLMAEAKVDAQTTRIYELRDRKDEVEKQLANINATVLEMAKKSNEVKIVEPKIVEAKVNFIQTPTQIVRE